MGCLKLSYYEQERALEVNPIFFTSAVEKNANTPFFCLSSSRYGFNGQEKDDEIKGAGNSYDFGLRIQDPRLGRFLSTDPFKAKFSDQSPYQFTGNSPIKFIDYNGGFRIPKNIAEKYPNLVTAANALSNWIENTPPEDLIKDPLFQQLISIPELRESTLGKDINSLKEIFANGRGPIISDASPKDVRQPNGEDSFAKTVPDGEIKGNSFVFLNEEFLQVVEGINVKPTSVFSVLNNNEMLAYISLIQTLIHEGIHAKAIKGNVDEFKLKIELGNNFERAFGSINFFLSAAKIGGQGFGFNKKINGHRLQRNDGVKIQSPIEKNSLSKGTQSKINNARKSQGSNRSVKSRRKSRQKSSARFE